MINIQHAYDIVSTVKHQNIIKRIIGRLRIIPGDSNRKHGMRDYIHGIIHSYRKIYNHVYYYKLKHYDKYAFKWCRGYVSGKYIWGGGGVVKCVTFPIDIEILLDCTQQKIWNLILTIQDTNIYVRLLAIPT